MAQPKSIRKGAIHDLLSGKVRNEAPPKRRARKRVKPPEPLPESVRKLSEVFTAGKRIQKELDFKVRYAEQRVKDFCVRRYCEIFAATGVRPPSVKYVGPHSQFTFIQSGRIALNPEKAQALRSMGVAIDEYTELRGLRVNYEAIRELGLEEKLRLALESMGVPEEQISEAFVPDVELKEGFFDQLVPIVRQSLREGDNLEEKLYEVFQVLQPATQIRNPDTPGLSSRECFELVENAEISADDEENLDAA